jgi:uncharacterized protein YpiB (UPF0302 family)
MILKLGGERSNWEVIIFYLIQPFVNETKRHFTRSKILGNNYDKIYIILAFLGHKKKPTSIEQTIQKTLQNMRDKGWIEFLRAYSGEYKLTDRGYEELKLHKENLKILNNLSKAEIEAARQIIEKRYV